MPKQQPSREPIVGVLPIHARTCPLAKAKRQDRWGSCRCKPTFRAQVSDASGSRRTKTFPEPRAADAWRKAELSRLEAGERILPAVTLEELWTEWYAKAETGAERAAGGSVYRPSVLRSYRGAWDNHIKPRLGSIKVHELRTPQVQNVIGSLQAAGLSPSTISNAITPLRVVLGWAVRMERIDKNPLADKVLRFPSGEVARDRIASPSEALELVQALPRPDDRALFATAYFAGLRRGELMGLTWADVDLSARTIRVERSYDPGAQRFLGPKTKKGRRTVGIAAILLPFLAALDGTEGLVFPSERGHPFSPFRVTERAREAWKTAKLEPLALHEGRHTFASLMIASNVNIKVISEMMGHASVSLTWDRYGHLVSGSRAQAMELFDAYLERELAGEGA